MEPTPFILITRIILAALLGAMIGYERKTEHKEAGVRTHALVAVGATLFTLISMFAITGDNVDPTRVMSQIVTGVGFLGAGMIIYRQGRVSGLTTAAGFWVCAAIGMAVGVGWYAVAVVSTLLVFFILYLLGRFFPALHNEESKK